MHPISTWNPNRNLGGGKPFYMSPHSWMESIEIQSFLVIGLRSGQSWNRTLMCYLNCQKLCKIRFNPDSDIEVYNKEEWLS